MTGPFMAFGEPWFDQHQGRLLCTLNSPALRRWARWVLRIPQSEVPLHQEILAIGPNRYSVGDTTVFRTHPKYAKRLYYAFRPGWWMMHGWDWCLPKRSWTQALDFGFATLTAYPDPHPETTTVDGDIRDGGLGNNWTLADLAAGTPDTRVVTDSAATGSVVLLSNVAPYYFYQYLSRGFFLFDTSSLGAGSTITAATFSLCVANAYVALGASPIDIVSSSPVSNTGLATADYTTVGSTSFGQRSSFTT
jgi:hypothetical protein